MTASQSVMPHAECDGVLPTVIDTVCSFPERIPSKPWLAEQLRGKGFSEQVEDWLYRSVRPHAGGNEGLEWTFLPNEAKEMYYDYRQE